MTSMVCGEDYLFRPLLEGMYKMESLKDGALSLIDVVKCNEALDVKYHNLNRQREN